MGAGAISLQIFQEADLIHSVIHLYEVKVYQEKGILVNVSKILFHIKPQDFRTCYPHCMEAMEDFVEVDT